MAVSKPTSFKGIELTYRMVLNKRWDKASNKTIYSVAGYTNEQARRDDIRNYLHVLSPMPVEGDLTVEQIYGDVKEQPSFRDCIDV